MRRALALLYANAGDCPSAHLHTEAPSEYAAWQQWAETMSKTHVQGRCPECGFWVMWRPR